MDVSERVRAAQLAEWAISRGIRSLTTKDAAALLHVPPDQVRVRLATPRQRGQWASPTPGLWIPVPARYQPWGAPPGIELIDILMEHLQNDYYVGWLNAAAFYGATHQAVQVFQVAVSAPVRDREVGRTRFRFYHRQRTSQIPVNVRNVDTGTVRVSTIAATALDVATDIVVAAGLDNMATVLIEMSEHPDFAIDAIADLSHQYPAAAGRRIGWVLDELAGRDDLDSLRVALAERTARPSFLSPWSTTTGPIDPIWNITINEAVEEES